MGRTESELKQELKNQRSAIRASCEGFDSGESWEAARIATAIINLLFDKRSAKSVLTQMGERATLSLLSTATPNPSGNALPWTPLVYSRTIVSSTAPRASSIFKPILDAPFGGSQYLPFEEWWAEVIYEAKGEKLSRGDLLRTLRDQDGGSHYDNEITDPAYTSLKDGAGWILTVDGETREVSGAATASARQIAYELEQSLAAKGL